MRLPVSVVLLALLAVAVVGSSTTASHSTTPRTSRVAITNGSGHTIVGVANYRTGRSRLWANWDMTGNADLGFTPGKVPMQDVEARGVSYLEVRSCAEGPCWWRIDHSRVPMTANFDQWALEDPFGLAKLIEGASAKVGVDYVRGVPTTHYEGTIDVERLLASRSEEDRASDRERYADLETKGGGLAGIAAGVWLDERGLPRRIQLERLGQRDTWEYYDFGVAARVALPPADEIMTSAELAAFTTGTR
jgi:hypothetical protein